MHSIIIHTPLSSLVSPRWYPYEDLPDGAPVISGVRSQYLPGDWVDITCTSSKSKPPAVLNFTVNTKPVSKERERERERESDCV